MTNEHVESEVRKAIVELWGCDPDKVTLDAMLGDDLDADSLDLVELIMDVEERLNIDIPDNELEGRFDDRSVKDVVDVACKYAIPQAA